MESAAQNGRNIQGGSEASAATTVEVLKFTVAKPGSSKQQMRRAHAVESLVINLENAGSRMLNVTTTVKWDI